MNRIKLTVALSLLLMITGCVSISKNQTHDEIDLVGVEATTPNVLNYGTATSVRIGIMHLKHFSNPTDTNRVYAAPYKYAVDAEIGTMKQTVTNSFEAGN